MIARRTIGFLFFAAVCVADPEGKEWLMRQREMREFNTQVERSEKELSALGTLPDVDFDPRAKLPLSSREIRQSSPIRACILMMKNHASSTSAMCG